MTCIIVCCVVWEVHTDSHKKEIWKEFCSIEIDSDDLRDHDAICLDEFSKRHTEDWKLVSFYVLPDYNDGDDK